MSELDETIREGLAEATEGAGEIEPTELALRLQARRGTSAVDQSHLRGTRARLLAAAALIVLISGVAGFVTWHNGRDSGVDVVTTDPAPAETGFDGWRPGWHEIDPGPVPARAGVSMTWFGNRLIVASAGFPEVGTDPALSPTGVWAFNPSDQKWSTLPTPPFETVSLITAGDQLVAVGGSRTPWSGIQEIDSPVRWATWSKNDAAWTDRGTVPTAPQLLAVGTTGPSEVTGESLVWTGERVFDFTRGAVLDPTTGDASALPMPDEVINYAYLIRATPVWTGAEVMLASWTPEPGLAWDSLGRRFHEIPGPPMGDSNTVLGGSSFVLDGRLMVMAYSESGSFRSASYDPTTGQWTELPEIQQSPPWCSLKGATVGEDLIVRSCRDLGETFGQPEFNPLMWLRDDRWTVIPRPPRPEQERETWLGTDNALVIWSGGTYNPENPNPPYRWAAVWIPDLEGDIESVDPSAPGTPNASAATDAQHAPSSPSTPSTPAPSAVTNAPSTTVAQECTVDELPDLDPALPAVLDTGPNPGRGGTGDTEGCFRYWGSSQDRGTHLTQYPGPSLFDNVSETVEGDYASFDIEDGFAVEYRGPHPWAANVYGISRSEFNEFVQRLLFDPARYETPGS